MIKILTGRYQKHIAWLLFLIFYGELAATLYARGDRGASYPTFGHGSNGDLIWRFSEPIAVTRGEQAIDDVIETPHNEQGSSVRGIPLAEREAEKMSIGGPGQPEMNTFKSIGADNMVNLFTGDFSYNIPLLDVGGYPINIFYTAGATMDQEASWVGLGWNINPGTISRNMRGLPDDYNGSDSIQKIQSIKKDLTIGVTGTTGMESIGLPNLSLDYGLGIFYNNRRGLGLETSVKGEYKVANFIAKKSKDEKKVDTLGNMSLSAGVTLNSQNGMTLNAGFDYSKWNTERLAYAGFGTSIGASTRRGLTDINLYGQYKSNKRSAEGAEMMRAPTLQHSTRIDFARSSHTPSIRMPLTRLNQSYTVKFGKEKKILFKNGSIHGYIQESKLAEKDREQNKPAYGYMHYERANGDVNALMDFNRLNDGSYTVKTPVISIPVYTYDVFSISGEGTGGSFRGYRGNMGYVRDHYTKTKSGDFNLSFDLGGGDILHAGVTLGGVYSPSFVKEWDFANGLRNSAKFNSTDSIYQSFYFKNPGETAIIDETYYNKLGGDKLIRPFLNEARTATPGLASKFQVYNSAREVEGILPVVTSDTYRKERDKRNQVITYLSAEDADRIGLDREIYSYPQNSFKPGSCEENKVKIQRYNREDPRFYRKRHHLSEIDVLEPDGRRYVYGIPVYQVTQSEVTFATESSPSSDNQLVSYTNENSVDNKKGRDGFFQKETVKGFAHSFLLTGILSPDYVDVLGDGITDDDLGTAIKFNYTRVNGVKTNLGRYWRNFKWRMPAEANKANYNEGLAADSRDDKGLYTYGEKELWYLHTIESKNMVATFRISGARNDGKQVLNENGGLALDTMGQKKLLRIDLYTKSDFMGSNPRPIKTVHFDYDYSLCPNFSFNDGKPVDKNGATVSSDSPLNVNKEKGKLTLKAIWFSYNGNDNQVKNKYVFRYGKKIVSSTNVLNPSYNTTHNDRWGNYKPVSANPSSMNNNHFPYVRQEAENNDYAAAWNLEKILLPGGAVLNVKYEADDYAFVQDRRAAQMTNILGFGKTKESTPVGRLYEWNAAEALDPSQMDFHYVFFAKEPGLNRQQVYEKYLRGIKQLLLKLWVQMPKGNIGSTPAYEPVVVYGSIKDFGVVDDTRFYVELATARKGNSMIMQTVMEFLKNYLPQRAYPGYETIGDGALAQVARSMVGLVSAFTQGVTGFERDLKLLGKCKHVDLEKSFARLNSPTYKKVGGGHRVKEVTVSDNWNQMTGQFESKYGQIYDYTKTEIVNGQPVTISSGVATYEPGIGNEENPFREVLQYSEHQFLGPTDHSNVELPIAETFFPAPMVGYSRVSVKSIHNKADKKIKSGIGLQQTEFYTSRDFPVISEYASFDDQSRHHHKPSVLEKIFNFNKRDYLTLTQGFRVVLNDMNGKLKSQTSYAENDYVTPVNYTANFYRMVPTGSNKFKLDNILPVISGPDGKVTAKLVGKDIEVMNDFREHFSFTQSMQIPINAEFFTVGGFPVLLPSLFRMHFRDEDMFRSATTLKIVNEYGILDSVVNIDKGSIVGTKNMIYDAESGDVLVSRTNNEFNKPVYQFNYPAWWVHTGMEPAYRNIDLTYKNILFRNGRIEGAPPEFTFNHFESGDEIYVLHSNEGPEASPGCVAGGTPYLLPPGTEYRIWALDIRKDLRNTTKEFIFIDRFGNPYNAVNATIRIVRSGKRNLAGASGGSIVSLANPIRTISGEQWLVLDSNANVLNAGIAEFKERWRANDMFYAKDTVIRTIKRVNINTLTFYTDKIHAYGEYRSRGDRYFDNINNPDHFAAEHYDAGRGRNDRDFRYKSWLRFNFTGFAADNVIRSATLKLFAHRTPHEFNIHNNKNEPPCPQSNAVYGPDRHNPTNPHIAATYFPNDFFLTRMQSTWPGDTDADCPAWVQQYRFNPPNGDMNIKKVQGTGQSSFINFNIPVTDLVRGMVRDKYDITKNYSTALRINQVWDWGTKAATRVCFFGLPTSGGTKMLADAGVNTTPRIDVAYYNCNDAGTLVYSGPLANVPPLSADSQYCITDTIAKLCFSVFSKKQMNPYIEGVLGNWRGWKSYVYYGERRESDPAVHTDIRTDGMIKQFEPYWALTATPTQKMTRTNSDKWVWNSEVTQYNRKGAELENRDPLGRFNSGIYGYQESLPVAVINNSPLRLSAFDGFEDYSYQDDPCEPFCKPSKRHFITGIPNSMIVDTQSHTGKYSVKIGADNTYLLDVKVSNEDTIYNPDIRIKLDSIPYIDSVMIRPPQGVGLKGAYYNNISFSGTPELREDKTVNLSFTTRIFGDQCSSFGSNSPYFPPAGVNCNQISVRWTGKIQVEQSGQYYFDIPLTKIDDIGYVYIDGQLVVTSLLGGTHTVVPVNLKAGRLHDIKVEFKQTNRMVGYIQLFWKRPGPFQLAPVPSINLYPEGKESLANGTVVSDTFYCVKPDTIQAINHHLIDSFNLVKDKKMIASVWMKKDGQDCKCTGYNNHFAVKNASGTVIATFAPKERIIEGWQQFEAIFTVPADNAKLTFDFRAPADAAVFIDDLRIHPFNANMKSFVYDPVTLRLAAELDENNFAALYEYDDDGGLIRVKKETRAGIKTIKETRSAVQKNITDLPN